MRELRSVGPPVGVLWLDRRSSIPTVTSAAALQEVADMALNPTANGTRAVAQVGFRIIPNDDAYECAPPPL